MTMLLLLLLLFVVSGNDILTMGKFPTEDMSLTHEACEI